MDHLFRELVEASQKIIITSHLGPDADAIGSSLCIYTTLKNQYPDKQLSLVIDGEFGDFASTFVNQSEIINGKVSNLIQTQDPDLIIFTDATESKRFEYEGGDALDAVLMASTAKKIIIDHHQFDAEYIKSFDLYINNLASSASEQVVHTLLHNGYGRFLHPNKHFDQTCDILKVLFATGLSMQDGQNCLDSLKLIHLKILATLLENVVVEDKYAYSFLTDIQTEEFWKSGSADFGKGTHMYTNQYGKNINGLGLGWMIHKDMMRPGFYKGSFRSLPGMADCVYITSFLPGGGHVTAAGFGFAANSLEEAITKIKHVIDEKGLLG
jgi:bifunctional oligoribonuclease and PAP phosphatase NrnA